jgi:CheY-like chemotaxis protein
VTGRRKATVNEARRPACPGSGLSSCGQGPPRRLAEVELPTAAANEDESAPARALLYIEDNLSNLKLVEEVLAHRARVSLLPAVRGRLGLQLAREHPCDLILLDLDLPDLSGIEVLARLQTDAATSDVPVVVLGADATPGEIEHLLARGASEYLTKPLDVRRFLEVLDEHVFGGGTSQPPARTGPAPAP